jgi:hypothetical protein
LVLHREEGESEVVLQPDVSALSRISWNWTSLARRNGPASYERLRFKVKFPSDQEQYCGGRVRVFVFAANKYAPLTQSSSKTRKRGCAR